MRWHWTWALMHERFKGSAMGVEKGNSLWKEQSRKPGKRQAVQRGWNKGCARSSERQSGSRHREDQASWAGMQAEEFRLVFSGRQRRLGAQRCFRKEKKKNEKML